jgi:hypothetical protein
MAARLNPGHQQSVRDKIQGSQLVNVLQDHALGKRDLLPSQIQAAKILLDKLVSNAPTDVNMVADQTINIILHKP